MANLTLVLGSPQATRSLAGGKGANLSKLMQGGFRVPAGFIVTSNAYQAFLQENDLERKTAEFTVSSPAAGREGASVQIQNLFRRGSMPDELRSEIIQAYRQLGEARVQGSHGCEDPVAVAVRSSAAVEDLPEASFAGQMETYLNVRGEEALIESIIECFSSLWTARALAYRQSRAGDAKSVQQAVIVQEMVPAESAGILFTLNPISGRRQEVVINAAWGLGQPVAGGQVTPDSIILDKASGEVRHVRVGSKKVMAVAADQGTSLVPVADEQRGRQVLSQEQARELLRLGMAIEACFGTPQDVEWAISGACIYVLQARPAAANLPQASPKRDADVPGDDRWPALGDFSPQPFDLWTRANVGEVWPEPVSPLVWSAVPEIIGGAMRSALRGVRSEAVERGRWAGRFYGRIYYNEGALRQVFEGELGLPASFVDRSRGNIQAVDSSKDGKFRLGRLLFRLPVLLRLGLRQRRAGKRLQAFISDVGRWVGQFNAESRLQAGDRQLLDEGMLWVERIKTAMNLQIEVSGLSLTAMATLERLMIRWFQRDDLARSLMTGLSGIQDAQVGADLWEIAIKLRESGFADVLTGMDPKDALAWIRRDARAAPALDLLQAFLARHGHHCPNEGEWLHPRWADEPEQVITLLAAYLKSGGPGIVEAEEKQRRRRESMIAWVKSRLGPIRRRIFRRLLARTEQAVRLRDNGKSAAIKACHPARKVTLQIGERWAGLGWIEEPKDVFFLTLPDLRTVIEAGAPGAAGLDLIPLVSERRRAFEHWSTTAAPDIVGPDGKAAAERESRFSESSLEGIAASGGRVRGKARIVLDPAKAVGLGSGDILVTRSTDAGWAALFPLISGLVTEIGGQLSHAAILAREYGLPSVVNVANATQRLREGQTITVDGSKGLVYPESQQESPADDEIAQSTEESFAYPEDILPH